MKSSNRQENELLRDVALRNAQTIYAARQRAEEELREAKDALERKSDELQQQREWFRVTLASIGDGVIATDVHGRITFMNPVAEQLTGWKAAEAAGQDITTVLQIIDQQTRRPAGNPVEQVLAKGATVHLSLHLALIAKDGSEVPIEDSAAPIRDPSGQISGVIMVFHDVSARRRTEEMQAYLAAVVAGSDDAIVSKTLEGIITSWNLGAQRTFGYTAEEVIGQPITILIPEDRQNEEVQILERLKRGESIYHFETVRRRKDGSLLDIALTISPIRDAAGRIIGASKIGRDITERKRAEAALAAQAEELEKKVNERTAALQQTVGELESFSYSISHDLRAPLRAMQSFALILSQECGDQVGPQGQDYIRRITTAAERMDRLIRDVLNYSRVARAEPTLTRVQLDKLIREVIESYPPFQPPKAKVQLKGPLPTVMANEGVLTQCVSNLLGNAVKFVAPGTIPAVEIWCEPAAPGWVRLSFKDNGIGIEARLHEKVFGMFERLSTTYEGTGIGLAIVKKGIERMGGKVGLISAPGQGSTFWLELQLAKNGDGG